MSKDALAVQEIEACYVATQTRPVVPAGYKSTDVAVIPEEWEISSIGELFKLTNGMAFKPEDWVASGVPIIRIQNLNDPTAAFNYTQRPFPERNKVEPGDLLFAWSGTVGTSFGARIWRGPVGVLNQHIFKVSMDERRIHKSFALNLFARVEEDIAKQAHGFKASFLHVKKSDLVKVKLPLPSLSEQKAIAAALSDVDALLQELDRLIAKKCNIKQATIKQLLTGQTRLPGFAGKWISRRLGDHAQFLRNGVNSRSELADDGSVRYLHYGDVHASMGVLLDPDSLPFLSLQKAKPLDRLQNGDLVIADASEDLDGVGKSVELHGIEVGDVVSGLHTIAIRFDRSFLADGFKAYLQFHPDFIGKLRRLAAGTKVYATTRSHVASVEMAIPDVKEQKEIALLLQQMEEEVDLLRSLREKIEAIKKAMLQELLTGRTRLV